MVLLSEEIAKILNCPVSHLRDRLHHPQDRNLVLQKLMGKKVKTTYKDRNGFANEFMIGGLSLHGADKLPAYGNLKRPFNVTVAAHFYCRHRIKLHHPFTHCIIEKFRNSGSDRYYPLELLEIVEDPIQWPFLGNLFAEIETEQAPQPQSCESSSTGTMHTVSDKGWGRNDLSQMDGF
jgi:hypothetical protein